MNAIQLTLFDTPALPCLPSAIAPANWQDIEPWRGDYRNGVRSAYPLYYQDADGVIWEYVFGGMGRYERWG